MADKKLSSVDVVNDMAFVYAETSDGKTVKISKADLASVAAGLMSIAGLIRYEKAITINTSVNETFDLPLFRCTLFHVVYVYNKSSCQFIATHGQLHIIRNGLPSAIEISVNGDTLTIAAVSGNYGLSIQSLTL